MIYGGWELFIFDCLQHSRQFCLIPHTTQLILISSLSINTQERISLGTRTGQFMSNKSMHRAQKPPFVSLWRKPSHAAMRRKWMPRRCRPLSASWFLSLYGVLAHRVNSRGKMLPSPCSARICRLDFYCLLTVGVRGS